MKEFKIIYYNLCNTSTDFTNFRNFTKSLGFSMALNINTQENKLKNIIILHKQINTQSSIAELKDYLAPIETYIQEFNLNFKCISTQISNVPILVSPENYINNTIKIPNSTWRIFYSKSIELTQILVSKNTNIREPSSLRTSRLCAILEL